MVDCLLTISVNQICRLFSTHQTPDSIIAPCVHNACTVYIALPSPEKHSTDRSGQATAAPVASGNARPMAPPVPNNQSCGEAKDVSPLTDKTVGERTSKPAGLLLPCSSCGILLPHTSSTLHPKRPVETYPLQAAAGVCRIPVFHCPLCGGSGYYLHLHT